MRSEMPEATVQNLSKDAIPKDNVINNDNNNPVLPKEQGYGRNSSSPFSATNGIPQH